MFKRFFRKYSRLRREVWWFIFTYIRVKRDCRNRENPEAIVCAARHAQTWACGAAKILNFEVVIHGKSDKFPGGLLVSNHQGYLDILAHAVTFPIRFAPQSGMKKWPLLGKFIDVGNPIWIDRASRQKSKKTADEMIETLEHGINLLVYPEGTSTDGEHGLLPFKSTPFEAAVAAKCAVQPLLTFFSSDDPTAYPLGWFGNARLLPHIWRVLGVDHIRADVYILPVVQPIPGEDRKDMAKRIYEFMLSEYERIKNNG
ncbi:MAG: 1-acyl-sn-glycerol-3-phosphate acyltransferase [Victivallales bacterium]|nr:1-acyl-sn-glycerol-3-phosphate acyltransferase [Victivallales bacterium]